jgi:hypothetical protein
MTTTNLKESYQDMVDLLLFPLTVRNSICCCHVIVVIVANRYHTWLTAALKEIEGCSTRWPESVFDFQIFKKMNLYVLKSRDKDLKLKVLTP